MSRFSRRATFVAFLLSASLCVGGFNAATGEESEIAISAKAVKYHDVLRKRPEPGYLFDRFYNTWLDDSTAADLQTFLTAKAAESKSTSDQLLLAFFFAKQGDDSAALEEFRAALEANPGSAEAWFQKAVIEARLLDFDAAIADLRKARDLKPEAKLQVQIDKQLGRLLVRNRQVDDALKIWNELLAANPNDDELAEDLIELHIDEGLYEQAAKLTESLIARTKDPYLTVTRRLRLGDVHQRAGNRKASLKAYATSLADVGHDSWLEQEILAQTEQVFRREDNLSQLKTHYDDLLKEHPKRIALHRRLAKLLVELGENDDAIAGYRKILELTPGDRANREEYIEVLAKIGQKKQAVEELTALCGQHPADGELKFRLAILLQEDGQGDKATEQLKAYLAASDKSEYAYLRAARQLERFERKDAAAEVYQEMATTFADSASAQEAYAAFLYATEKKPEALAIWRKLAEGAELSELLHVSRALATRNEHEPALELLQAREKDFSNEPLYFSQMATTALALKKPELALPWTRRRVELAKNAPELESALDQAVAAADRSDKIEDSIAALAALPRRSIQQNCLLAELHEAAGDSGATDEILKKPAEAGDILAVGEQIRLYSQRRDWAAAAAATRRVLELPEGRKSIYVRRLVELYQRDYQLEEALKWIPEWKRLSPGSTTPWTVEAGLLQSQGKEDDAIAVLKSAVQKFEDAEDLRLRLAQVYAETDHIADAERIYWQLYEETEDVTGKLRWTQELTKLAEQQGKLTQLVEKFEERRQSNRQSIVPLLALSEVHRTADNYEGRRQALTAAAKIKPDDLELLHHISRVEEQEGDWNAAIATLQRAAPLDKTNRTKERIAKLHLSYGNSDEGFAILFELAGAGQGDPRTIEAIADAMCGLQEWERAADFLAGRINDHPGDYRLLYLLAVASEEAGRSSDAIAQFTALLEDQEELPEVAKKNMKLTASNPYIEALGKMAPREAIEFMELSQSRYQAYMHQQNRGNAYSLGSVGGPATTIHMPSAVAQVRPLAVAHLTTIGKLVDEDEAADMIRGMKLHGVEAAELMMRFDVSQGNFAAELPSFLDENPENKLALALVVLNQFGNRAPELAKYSESAVNVFRDDYPELAMLAAFQAGLSAESEAALESVGPTELAAPKANPHFDQSLKLADTIEEPNPMTVMNIAYTLSGEMNGNQQAPPMSDKYRNKFSDLLMRWYPALRKNNQYGSWAFAYVVRALSKGDDPAAYIAFLEDELARSRQKGNPSRQQSQLMMHHRQSPTLLAPLTFPPQQLADFPAELLAVLQAPNDSDPFGGAMASQPHDFDEKKLEPLIQKVRDPVLRLLLANRFEKKELVDSLLAEQMKAEKPQLDVYMLAAGKASADEDHAEAAELLSKVRYLPMHRDLRTRVDAALVAAVIAGKEAKSGDVESDAEADADVKKPDAAPEGEAAAANALVEAGRAACLRLRQTRLDPNHRTELIAAMEDLGLKSEAEKLDKLAAAQSASSPAAAVMMRSTASRTVSADRITKLVADGKRDAAARLLSAEVLQQARQVIANPNNGNYMRHQFRELKTRIGTLGMTEELLKSIDPGDSANPQRTMEYAVVCEAFERPQDARAAYEKLLEKRPKDDALRMRLAMLLAVEDVKLAEEHLKQLKPAASMTIGQSFVEKLHDYDMEMDKRMACAELAATYLKTLTGQKNVQTEWSSSFVQVLSGPLHNNSGSSLPSLLSTTADEGKKTDAQKKLIERRRTAFDAICNEMLKTPSVARTGFTYLLAAAEAREQVNHDEFTARAAKLLRDEAETPPAQSGNYNRVYSYNHDASNVQMQSPEEYLVRRGGADDWKLIDDELLPALEKSPNKKVSQELSQMAKLYRCPEEEFLATAEEVTKRARPIPGMQDEAADLSVIVAAWGHRKLKLDIQPLILERLKRASKTQNHHQTPPCIADFVEATYQTRGGAEALDLLEEITTIYLGPKEKRDAFLAANNTNGGWSYGSPQGSIHVYGQFMSQMMQRESVLPIAVFYMQSLPALGAHNNIDHYAYQGMSNLAKRPSSKLVDELRESPWLADLDRFDPLDGGAQRHGSASWLSWYLQTVAKDAKQKAELTKAIAAAYATRPTFGLGLIDAHLRGGNALPDFIAGELDKLQSLDEERQARIAATLVQLLYSGSDAEKNLSKTHGDVHVWLQGSKKLKSQQLLTKLRKAKTLEEISPDTYNIGDVLRPQMSELIASDKPAACEAFFRVLELVADAQKRNQWHMHFGDGRTAASYVLQNMLNQLDMTKYDRLPLLVDLLKNDKKVTFEFESSQRFGVANVLGRQFDSLMKEKNGKKLNRLKAIQRIHDEIGKSLDGRPSSLFVDAYFNLFTQKLSDDKDLHAVRDWAKSQVAGGKYPALSADFYAAAVMVDMVRLEKQAKEKGAAPPEPTDDTDYCRQHFKNIINDAELPLAWRIHLAELITRNEGDRLPEEVGQAVLTSFNEGLKANLPLTTSQHRSITKWLAGAAKRGEVQPELAAWRDAWAARYLRLGATSANRYETPYELRDVDALCHALKIYLHQKDENRINQFLRRHDDSLQSSPLPIVLLLRAEKPELAARFLRSHWVTLTLSWPTHDDAAYDEVIEAQTQPLVEKLLREEERLFARALLASLPDPAPPKAGEEKPAGEQPEDNANDVAAEPTPRDARMLKLADEFRAATGNDDAYQIRTLAVLGTSPPTNERLRDQTAAQFAKLALPISFQQDDDQRWKIESELAARHFDNQFAAGDPTAFTKSFTELVASIGEENAYNEGMKVAPLIDACFKAIQTHGNKFTPEQFAALGRAVRSLLDNREYLYLNEFRKFNSVVLFSHLRGEITKELPKWEKNLSGNCRSWVKNAGVDDKFWGTLSKLHGQGTPENLSERIKLMEDAIAAANDLGWLIYHNDSAHHLTGYDRKLIPFHAIKSGLLKRKDLLAYATQIEPVPERHFMVNVLLGEWLANQKQYAESATLFEAALPKMPESWKNRAANWRLRAGLSWALAGNMEKAQGWVDEVSKREGLQQAEQARLKQLIKTIKEKSGAPAADAKAAPPGDKATPAAVPAKAAFHQIEPLHIRSLRPVRFAYVTTASNFTIASNVATFQISLSV